MTAPTPTYFSKVIAASDLHQAHFAWMSLNQARITWLDLNQAYFTWLDKFVGYFISLTKFKPTQSGSELS